jgi:hypothetical protein
MARPGRYGFVDAISKPMRQADLCDKLAKVLRKT